MQNGTTIRYCLTSDLKHEPALIEEYRRWHASEQIWPDIPQGIREAGILDMEIYLLGTRLVMVIEAEAGFDLAQSFSKLSTSPRHQAWEKLMSKFQDTKATTNVADKWLAMERIFKLA